MQKSPQKKKKTLKIFLSILIIGIALLAVIYLSLPFLLEKILVPGIANSLGFEHTSLKVNRADFNGLGITSLMISDRDNTGIKVGRLDISAEDTEIRSVEIDGLDLYFELKNGKLKIPGIKAPQSQKKSSKNNIYQIPPYISQNFSLSIVNSGLKLHIEKNGKNEILNIPFAVELNRKGEKIIFSSRTETFNYIDEKLKLSVPEFQVNGSIKPENEKLIVSGIANFANISFQAGKIKVENIKGQFPFYFILSDNGISFNISENIFIKQGNLSVGNILLGEKSLGKADFSIQQKENSFVFNGSCQGLTKDNIFLISGNFIPPESKNSNASELTIFLKGKSLDIELGEFHPKAKSVNFKGDIDLSTNVGLKNSTISAKSKIAVKNGCFEDKNRDLYLNGLALDFELENALKFRSKPSQILSFNELKFKAFNFANGKIVFQTESLKRYLIEKSEFKWSQGHVSANAFRINSANPEDIDLILYCDRLNVADLLNQFNVGKASGEGTVSGKIPLIYKNKRILIDDGFLYSTPGIGGNISLTDFMGPLANVPKGIGMDISTEALKDFDYNWLRIKLNSEIEDLLLILEIDGKPAPEFLPFTMDFTTGILKKSTNPNTKAKFKGISFQINFRLPANQMLEYGTRFKEISGKLKK